MKKFLKYLDKIRNNGIDGDTIFQMVQEHSDDHKRMVELYDRYQANAKGVPILRRSAIQYEDFETERMKRLDDKVNNRLHFPFDVDIIDTKVGYLFGVPLTYMYEGGETYDEKLSTFNLRNHVEDMDSEWGKMAAICGYGARIAYVELGTGDERIVNIDPWEMIFIGEKDISEPEYALRYFEGTNGKNKAEFYDDTYVYYFEAKESGKYEFVRRKAHLFSFTPAFGLANNKELQGDVEKVLSLIDDYDRAVSDVSNEIEQYRLAYLVLKGMGADEETINEVKQTGIFELYDENQDVKYLTKDVNDSLIENHLNRTEEKILHLAKSVNFSDEQFAGNISGVAMKYKLLALENKCKTMERKMTAALRYQYRVLFSAWSKREQADKDDYLNVSFTFTRNLPVNLVEEAQVQNSLQGVVSDETRLAQFSAVDDVQAEQERMKAERDEYMQEMPDVGEEDESGTD